MGWWQGEQQKQTKYGQSRGGEQPKQTKLGAQKEKKAAEQAQKDQEAAARNQLTNSWKDLYSSGGDLAVAESILSGHANGGTYTQQDLAAAKAVKEDGKTFGEVGQAAIQASYDQWNMVTGNGKNTTKYGPDAQSIYQIFPWEEWSQNVQQFKWSDGSYDERIKAEKAAADKAAADKAAAQKAAADEAARKAEQQRQADALAKQQADAEAKRQADLDKAQRQKDAAAQAALQTKTKPAPTPQAPVKKETPIEEAKGRTEEYTKTTTQNGNTITNNIEQNIGNRGNIKTSIGDNSNITNSEFGNDKSQNIGNINVTNQQNQDETKAFRSDLSSRVESLEAHNAKIAADKTAAEQAAADKKDKDDYVWGLAKERANDYTSRAKDRVTNGNTTVNNSYTFNNDFLQNIGNKGDITTNIGANSNIRNSAFGNDYSINLGSINSSNYSM